MARLPRLVVPGQPLHVIQRGNDRIATFRGVTDYLRYLDILGQASRATAVSIHAYVLMSNHVHLLLTPEDEHGPARLMQRTGRLYVRFFNTKYERTGTLWESRYRSSLIDRESYFLACARYIELNPVRAGMVVAPSGYRWSSYGHNARGIPDVLITPHPMYLALGDSPAERRATYRRMFGEELPSDTLDEIRRSTQRGDALGTEPFRRRLETALRRIVVRAPRGGRVSTCRSV